MGTKTARQMFEEAGFTLLFNNSNGFEYFNEKENIHVCFGKENKVVSVFHEEELFDYEWRKHYISNCITKEILKLIIYQYEELGWL